MKSILKLVRVLYSLPTIMYGRVIILHKLRNWDHIKNFQRMKRQYSQIYERVSGTRELILTSDGYSWDSWSLGIKESFAKDIDIGFLSNKLIKFTMVFIGKESGVQDTKLRAELCKEVLGEEVAQKLMREDFVGLPRITNIKYKTSANRAHHASHLAAFTQITGQYIWESSRIIEWGGGYGSMARLIRKMRPNVTYVIIDLPELLALQYIYLGSLEGESNIHIMDKDNFRISEGKINLVNSEFLLTENISLACDLFISTWALSECPKNIQEFVEKCSYFSANKVFLAVKIDANNHINNETFMRRDVPNLEDEHQYWAKR